MSEHISTPYIRSQRYMILDKDASLARMRSTTHEIKLTYDFI